jgi:hypothetical protein
MIQTGANHILPGKTSQVAKRKKMEEKLKGRCRTMSNHPAHDITVPDPQLTFARLVPNACNQSHLDRSVYWAVTARDDYPILQ